MTLFPIFRLGLWNLWLPTLGFYLIFGLLLWIFPLEVVRRLYDRSYWTPEQHRRSRLPKLLGLVMLILEIFIPIRPGLSSFWPGLGIYLLGLIGVVWALITYRLTPLDQPVTAGLYRVSRNPQWVSLVWIFFGTTILSGSWFVIGLVILMAAVGHYRILAEENACLIQYGDSYQTYLNQVPRYFLFF